MHREPNGLSSTTFPIARLGLAFKDLTMVRTGGLIPREESVSERATHALRQSRS